MIVSEHDIEEFKDKESIFLTPDSSIDTVIVEEDPTIAGKRVTEGGINRGSYDTREVYAASKDPTRAPEYLRSFSLSGRTYTRLLDGTYSLRDQLFEAILAEIAKKESENKTVICEKTDKKVTNQDLYEIVESAIKYAGNLVIRSEVKDPDDKQMIININNGEARGKSYVDAALRQGTYINVAELNYALAKYLRIVDLGELEVAGLAQEEGEPVVGIIPGNDGIPKEEKVPKEGKIPKNERVPKDEEIPKDDKVPTETHTEEEKTEEKQNEVHRVKARFTARNAVALAMAATGILLMALSKVPTIETIIHPPITGTRVTAESVYETKSTYTYMLNENGYAITPDGRTLNLVDLNLGTITAVSPETVVYSSSMNSYGKNYTNSYEVGKRTGGQELNPISISGFSIVSKNNEILGSVEAKKGVDGPMKVTISGELREGTRITNAQDLLDEVLRQNPGLDQYDVQIHLGTSKEQAGVYGWISLKECFENDQLIFHDEGTKNLISGSTEDKTHATIMTENGPASFSLVGEDGNLLKNGSVVVIDGKEYTLLSLEESQQEKLVDTITKEEEVIIKEGYTEEKTTRSYKYLFVPGTFFALTGIALSATSSYASSRLNKKADAQYRLTHDGASEEELLDAFDRFTKDYAAERKLTTLENMLIKARLVNETIQVQTPTKNALGAAIGSAQDLLIKNHGDYVSRIGGIQKIAKLQVNDEERAFMAISMDGKVYPLPPDILKHIDDRLKDSEVVYEKDGRKV